VPFSDKDEAKRLGAGFEYYKDGQRPEGAPGCEFRRKAARYSELMPAILPD
jgi:hypothetical protein